MLTINHGEALSRALSSPLDRRLKELLTERIRQLDVEDLSTAARFVIVEPGDTLNALETELGFAISDDPEVGFGCEWVEDHGHCHELVFILTDDGFAHVAFVPRQPDIDAALLSLCALFASEQTIG